jgi:hypothetical protein
MTPRKGIAIEKVQMQERYNSRVDKYNTCFYIWFHPFHPVEFWVKVCGLLRRRRVQRRIGTNIITSSMSSSVVVVVVVAVVLVLDVISSLYFVGRLGTLDESSFVSSNE